MCAYAGQPVSILGDLDIRLVLTEIVNEMEAPRYEPPTAEQADQERDTADTALASNQRSLVKTQIQEEAENIYEQIRATAPPAHKAPPPAQPWTAARPNAESQAQHSHDSYQHQTADSTAADQQPHYADANIWTGPKQDPPYRRRKHSDYHNTQGTKGGAGKGKYDHMRQIVPAEPHNAIGMTGRGNLHGAPYIHGTCGSSRKRPV